MKAIVLALLIGLCASCVHATKIEFGMQFGPLSYFRYDSQWEDRNSFYVSFPAARAVYAQWSASDRLWVGPYMSFSYARWSRTDSNWHTVLGALVSYYPRGANRSKVYVTGRIGTQLSDYNFEEDGGPEIDPIGGVGLGFQLGHWHQVVWDAQINYDRWLKEKPQEVSFMVLLAKRHSF